MITGPIFVLGAILMIVCAFLGHDNWGMEVPDHE